MGSFGFLFSWWRFSPLRLPAHFAQTCNKQLRNINNHCLEFQILARSAVVHYTLSFGWLDNIA